MGLTLPQYSSGLGMHQRIAVDLGGGGQQEAGPFGQRQPQRLVRAQRAHLECLDRHVQIVHRAGQAGQVQHRIERALDEDVLGHVVLDEVEALVAGQVGDVVHVAGAEVVHGDHLVALSQQAVAEMGADEAGSAGDENAHRLLL